MSNPILRKEVLTSLRTRKALAMQVVYLVVLIGIVFFFWPDRGMQSLDGQQARGMLSVLAIGQLALIALFAPAFTSTSLTGEKEHNTFESLFATRLAPWEIAFGKMAGALAFLLILVLMGTPVLAALFLLGGINGRDVLGVLGILVLTALYLGGIGLLVSALMHRSYRSIITTYALLVLVVVLLAAPAWEIGAQPLMLRAGPIGARIFYVLAALSPLQAMLSLVAPGSRFARPMAGLGQFWSLFLIQGTLVFLGVAGYLLLRLRRPFQPPRPRERLKVVERGRITARSFLFLFDPARRKPMIRWWQNPVAIKEFRTRTMLQIQWLLRVASICLMISIGLMLLVAIIVQAIASQGAGTFDSMLAVAAVLQVVLIVLLGPACSSGAICADREGSVWDLMRNSRLRSWTIVAGKMQACLMPLALLILATSPALLILLAFDVPLQPILRCLAVVAVASLFVVVLGMFFSSLAARTSTATAWTYGVVVALSVLSLLALFRADRFSEGFMAAIFLPNPVAAALDAAGAGAFQKYSLFARHVQWMLAATAGLFLITVARVWHLRRPD